MPDISSMHYFTSSQTSFLWEHNNGRLCPFLYQILRTRLVWHYWIFSAWLVSYKTVCDCFSHSSLERSTCRSSLQDSSLFYKVSEDWTNQLVGYFTNQPIYPVNNPYGPPWRGCQSSVRQLFLNTEYNLPSGCIAAKMKWGLSSLVAVTQSGFPCGR